MTYEELVAYDTLRAERDQLRTELERVQAQAEKYKRALQEIKAGGPFDVPARAIARAALAGDEP
jgi:hypothetical protein